MEFSIRFIYFDGEEIKIDIPYEVTITMKFSDDRKKVHIQKVYDANEENINFSNSIIKKIYNEVPVSNLKTIEFLANNNVVDYISGYKFVKSYAITDVPFSKAPQLKSLSEMIDIDRMDD